MTIITAVLAAWKGWFLTRFDARLKEEKTAIAEYRRLLADDERRFLKLETRCDELEKQVEECRLREQKAIRENYRRDAWMKHCELAMRRANIPFDPFVFDADGVIDPRSSGTGSF